MDIPVSVYKHDDLHYTASPFGSYEEAKIYAINLFSNIPVVDLKIEKRKYDPIWAVSYTIPNSPFMKKEMPEWLEKHVGV